MIKTLFQRKVMEEQNIFIQTMSRQGRESKFNIKRQNIRRWLSISNIFLPITTSGWIYKNSRIFISALWCLCPGGGDWWVRGWTTGHWAHWAGQGITDYARARPSSEQGHQLPSGHNCPHVTAARVEASGGRRLESGDHWLII